MSHELKGNLNNSLNLNGSMNLSGNLRGQFQLGGGGGGTTDYEDLSNKPSINGHTLEGDSSTADLQLDYDDLLNKPVIPDMSGYYDKTETDTLLADKANTADLATVATTGDYDDLINKPVIPDMTDYYNKTETDSLLDDKVNQSQISQETVVYPESGTVNVARIIADTATGHNNVKRLRIGPYYVQSDIDSMLAQKADSSSLAAVATSGDYDDLTNKPVIPPIDLGSNNKMVMLEDHLGSTPVTTAAGSLYRSAEKTFNFSGFTNVKAIFATGTNATGSTSSWIAITSRTNSSVSFVVMRYSSSTLSDYTVSFLIIGE